MHRLRPRLLLPFYFLVLPGAFPSIAGTQPDLRKLHEHTDKLVKAGDFAGAVKNNNKVLDLAEQRGDCYYQVQATYKAGALYDGLDRPRAIRYFRKCIAMASSCKNTEMTYWYCLRHLGAVYLGLRQRDSALYYLGQSYRIIVKTRNYARIASNAGMLGEAWSRLTGDTASASRYYRESLAYAAKSDEYGSLGYAYLRYGGFLATMRKSREGLRLLEQAREIFASHKDLEGLVWTLKGMSDGYFACGEFAKAKQAADTLVSTQDSLFKSQVAQKTAQYEVLYETEKKERENIQKDVLIQEETRRRHVLLAAFTTTILLLTGVFYLLYCRYRARKQVEAERERAEMQRTRFQSVIDAEDRERARIARELHDGVGHLLSSAKLNLSAVEAVGEEDKALTEHAMTIIDEALTETRAISHNLAPSVLSELGLEAALAQLVRKLNQSGKLKAGSQLTGGDPGPARSVHIYRIVQEAVNNILKHADARNVTISLSRQVDQWELVISDDGVGFAPGAGNSGGGIGLKNLFTRSELLNGSLELASAPGRGSTLTIRFPHE